MARMIERLSPLKIAKLAKAGKRGMWCDGGGLYLHVGPTGGASWILRFMIRGKARSMGLGPYPLFGLSEARDRARTALKMRYDGVDPLEAKHASHRARKIEAAKAIIFRVCAEHYLKANRAGWKNTKHAAQWASTLKIWAYPIIGSLPVGEVDTGHVTRILQQDVKGADGKSIGSLWETRSETASRLRGRIESILDYAKVNGWREGENPARWKGHLENVLPKKSKVRKVGHHAALPYVEVGEFMEKLRAQDGTAARALEYAILTAARTGEVLGATWEEIDLQSKVWTIPAERMKAGREHRVPLSDAALAVLHEAEKLRTGDNPHVFPGGKAGKPLTNMALLMTLRRMGHGEITAHGFRSTFRDWCSERTSYPAEVAEMALAHAVGDKVEQAYRRGDLLAKRRQLAEAWAKFCASPFVEAGNVTALHGGSAP